MQKKQGKKPVSKKVVKKTKKKATSTVLKKRSLPVKKVKRRKLRLGRIFLFLCCLILLGYTISHCFSFPIHSVFIEGNTMLSDQEILELAHLEEYPSYFAYTKGEIERKLEKNTYILNATVKKKKFREIWILIEENRPLFYDSSSFKTVLKDQTTVDSKENVPTLLNYVPDTIYDTFVKNMAKIDMDVFTRISEIQYDPNRVDKGRFLFSMNDGNYVYVTVRHMDKINHYVDIMQKVLSKYENKNGILFLDEGEYFEVFEDESSS